MNVPRETVERRRARSASLYPFNIRHLQCADWEIRALRSGVKHVSRFAVTEENSIVHPGKWVGLMLETGRGFIAPETEIRARCRFESGKERAVHVFSRIKSGDLFWVQSAGSGKCRTRATSDLTLAVERVKVSRLQDLDDDQARLEGIVDAPTSFHRSAGTPRELFQLLHEARFGRQSWIDNGWVWVVEYIVRACNVDAWVDLYSRKSKL